MTAPQETVLGYRVEKVEPEGARPGEAAVAYELHDPRGARYGLVRNVPNPSMLFAVNLRRFGVVQRLGWFTDGNGRLEHVR